jgi:DNA repair protein RadC
MEGAMSCLKDWPVADRPREKLLSRGSATLSDTELLALILRSGHAGNGSSALDLSRQLLNRFGSLRAMVSATATELCEEPGIGPAKAAEILALGELARRFAATLLAHGTRFTSSRQVFAPFHERLRDLKKEVFLTLILDSNNGFSVMGPGAVYLNLGEQSLAVTGTRPGHFTLCEWDGRR